MSGGGPSLPPIPIMTAPTFTPWYSIVLNQPNVPCSPAAAATGLVNLRAVHSTLALKSLESAHS